jgi:hypothetical protein
MGGSIFLAERHRANSAPGRVRDDPVIANRISKPRIFALINGVDYHLQQRLFWNWFVFWGFMYEAEFHEHEKEAKLRVIVSWEVQLRETPNNAIHHITLLPIREV